MISFLFGTYFSEPIPEKLKFLRNRFYGLMAKMELNGIGSKYKKN
jgi:hypothetical protein